MPPKSPTKKKLAKNGSGKDGSSPDLTTHRSGAPSSAGARPMTGAHSSAAANQSPEDDLYKEAQKQIKKPPNQLQLSEAQLKEEHTRVLTANDPNVPTNITKYNYKERVYKIDPPGPGDHLAIHFSLDGCCLHVDSEEAKIQLQMEQKRKEEMQIAMELARKEVAESEDPSAGAKADLSSYAGKNQFNYSERAAQTFNNPMKDRCVETVPPPVVQFKSIVTQWEIYDAYMAEYEKQQKEAEAAKSGVTKKAGTEKGEAIDGEKKLKDDMVHSAAMGKSLKIMERMVNQNAEDEIFQDFKYWEDVSDQFRNGEGSLLPLWRFSTERSKRKQVTAICWNPGHPTLFAVGYGSYEYMKQSPGMICCFSLKNTSHPEFLFSCPSGVMCLDFHPQHHSLLAVGCYDGTVMVYDVRQRTNRPIYTSTIKTGKHTDPVWQVYWQDEDLAKELNFFSISSDGKVANWIMSKNELKMELVMQLKLVNTLKDDPEETSLSGLAGGCCFDFNKFSEHLFVVGTEEGKIHKCSKAYSGQYLETYQGHHMAVYAVRWNPFHPRVFISCSADWTVKIWDHNLPYPVMSFDLGNAVGDVFWAPYSATVFAAVTNDGKVHVFDLAENKHEPLCEQKVVKKSKLTHVCFNKQDPIILVGDDRGGVNSMKLSPNLRKIMPLPETKDDKGVAAAAATGKVSEAEALAKARQVFEMERMEKLLAAVDSKPEQ